MLARDIEIGQVVDQYEVENRSDEHAKKIRKPLQHLVPQCTTGPPERGHQHQQENRQPQRERHDDEQGRQQRAVVMLACDEESEDRTGSGRQYQAPGECEQPGTPGVAVHAPLEHGPQINRDNGEKPRVEENIPGKDRLEVVVRHRDDQAVGPPEVEHQDGKPAGKQRDGKKSRKPSQRLVQIPPEHRGDRSHVERPGGRHDQKHREHVRSAPYDPVAHAGDIVAVMLHVPCGAKASPYQYGERPQQRVKTTAAALDFPVLRARHGYSPW